VLDSLLGAERLARRADKVGAKVLMHSRQLGRRVLALQRLVYDDGSLAAVPKEAQIPAILEDLQERIADLMARKTVADELERRLAWAKRRWRGWCWRKPRNFPAAPSAKRRRSSRSMDRRYAGTPARPRTRCWDRCTIRSTRARGASLPIWAFPNRSSAWLPGRTAASCSWMRSASWIPCCRRSC